jgi:hypothetical protein
MTTPVDQVVLTRFNLPSQGYESLIRAQEGWLRSRVALFERYCLPSMRAQTYRGSWVIYFDPESPAWLLDWIERTNRHDFHPVFRATVSHAELLNDIRLALGSTGETLITTNLDNDDAVANDFLARVAAAATPGRRTAVYLADGLIADGRSVYRRVDPHNAFCSVAEPWEEPVTCWERAHNRLGESMPVRSVRGRPAWLQIIHGENVSNRVRGRLVSPSAHRASFGAMLDDRDEPGTGRIIRDRLLDGPGRVAREAARATAKRTTIALFGADGIDAVKVRAARLTHTTRPAHITRVAGETTADRAR